MVARLCSFANASGRRALSAVWVLPEHDPAPSAQGAVLEKGPLPASLPVSHPEERPSALGGGRDFVSSLVVGFYKTSAGARSRAPEIRDK